jgi:N-acetylmuramoyl-L-alanine amidase
VGRIFIDAGHSSRDPGAIVGGTTEAKEMILLRNLVVGKLQNRGFDVLSVPDPLSMSSTIQWINAQGRRGDVALEIRANAYHIPMFKAQPSFTLRTISSVRKMQSYC